MGNKYAGSVPQTTPDPERLKYKKGVKDAVFYMRVLEETRIRLRDEKELTHDQEIEMKTATMAVKKTLLEFFRVPETIIAALWDKINLIVLDDKAKELMGLMKQKVIMPGQARPGLFVAKIDPRAMAEEIKRKIS